MDKEQKHAEERRKNLKKYSDRLIDKLVKEMVNEWENEEKWREELYINFPFLIQIFDGDDENPVIIDLVDFIRDVITKEVRMELEALAKECIGEELDTNSNDFDDVLEEGGYNRKRQEVIEAFKRRGI